MALFTFVLDYCGGTYLSQVDAENFEKAPGVWAAEMSVDHVETDGELFKNQLTPLIDFETPVAVEGLLHTWCLTFTISNELAIVHYCLTIE